MRTPHPSNDTPPPRSFAACKPSTTTPAAMNACACTSVASTAASARRSSRSTTIRANAWRPTSGTSMCAFPRAAGWCRCWWSPGRTPIVRLCSPCPANAPRRSCTAWSRPSRSSVACRAKCGGTTPRPWRLACSRAVSGKSTSVTRRWPATTPLRRCFAWCVGPRRSHASRDACGTCNATGPRPCPRFTTWPR